MVNEAQECLGGAGYVEESIMPRLYREAPLNSIWEGCGNIQSLDVLRALGREPETADAFFTEVGEAKGAHPALDRELIALRDILSRPKELEIRSRYLVERMALACRHRFSYASATPSSPRRSANRDSTARTVSPSAHSSFDPVRCDHRTRVADALREGKGTGSGWGSGGAGFISDVLSVGNVRGDRAQRTWRLKVAIPTTACGDAR
jgi:hypothetical protein